MGYNTLQDELDIIGMNLLPPFHSEAEPGKDYATIIGKIHRFSSELGSKFLYHVSLHQYQNELFIGSIRDNVPCDVTMDSQHTKFRPVNIVNVCKNIMLDRLRRSSRLALVDTI
ncbi:hypothetical protein V9T40_000821 [Parthenolecanium corni]|uniref:Uncharacterized protein n=1 Tax=Parthenolecanium corni TaxID=536013 RepID=A0AAN9TN36_9HEMI